VYIGQNSQEPANRRPSSLPPFTFGNGYSLRAFDLGGAGVKLELHHEGRVNAAIMLPAQEAGKLGKWLLRTLGQDEHGFPVELAGLLERLSKAKVEGSILERGDKKRIREALQALRS
jgi:hypothetical protein